MADNDNTDSNQCTNDQNESTQPAPEQTSCPPPPPSDLCDPDGTLPTLENAEIPPEPPLTGTAAPQPNATLTGPTATGTANANGAYGALTTGTFNAREGNFNLELQGPHVQGGARNLPDGTVQAGAQGNLGCATVGYNGNGNESAKGGACLGFGFEARYANTPNKCSIGADVGPLTFDISTNGPCPTPQAPDYSKPGAARRAVYP